MANYFTSFFAKKVRRSEDDKWRTTRFDTMAKVLTRIEPELLKKSTGMCCCIQYPIALLEMLTPLHNTVI